MRMNKDQRRVLWLLSLTMLLVVLDSAIINVALPAIKSALHFSTAALQWVLTGYILTFGGFLMLGGRTADLYGRRRVLVAGIAGFGLFSLAHGPERERADDDRDAGSARDWRGLYGAYRAVDFARHVRGGPRPQPSVIGVERGGIGGAAAGVFLGGVLTQYFGWRWCFFVNVPVAIVSVWLILKHVPAHIAESEDKHLDMPGAVLVTGGLMALVYALTLAAQAGWTAVSTLGWLGASGLMLAVFLVNETRAKHPLMPLSIFRLRNVSGGNLMLATNCGRCVGHVFLRVALYSERA